MARRVTEGRNVQTARYGVGGPRTNAEADGELLMRVATPDGDGVSLLARATERMKLSARGYHRASRAPSPTSTARRVCVAPTSPRRLATAGSPTSGETAPSRATRRQGDGRCAGSVSVPRRRATRT